MRKTLLSLAFLAGCYAPHPNMVGERTPQEIEQRPVQQAPSAPEPSPTPEPTPPTAPILSVETRNRLDVLRNTQSAEDVRRAALEIAQIYSTRDSLERRLEQKAYENRQARMAAGQRNFTEQELDGEAYRIIQQQINTSADRLADLYCEDPQRYAQDRPARIQELEQAINGYDGYGLAIVVMPVERQAEPQAGGGQPEQAQPPQPPRYEGREEREARMRLADLQRRRTLCQSQYDDGRINQTHYDSSIRALDSAIRDLERRLPN